MTHELGRRELMTGTVAGLAAVAVATSGGDVLAQSVSQAALKYSTKPLGINPKSIKGLSEKIITSHYDNNYTGAVNRLNSINAELAKLDVSIAPPFVMSGLKREQLIATNSMILHEIYFSGFGAGGDPKGEIATALTRDFGSVDAWRAEFATTGKALGGGSGWVLLTYSPRLGRLVNQWAADHSMAIADGVPVLALDMYEHAYHMDYGAKAAAYVDAFMDAINWDGVAASYSALRSAR